jgi:rRNA-processing protein EBP2
VQVVTLGASTDVPDINDDVTRELAFYNNAKQAAEEAIARFEEAGVPWQRPADYYAENVKSDSHMAKVKEQLMYEQRAIEEAEQRWAASCLSAVSRRPHMRRRCLEKSTAIHKQPASSHSGEVDVQAEESRGESVLEAGAGREGEGEGAGQEGRDCFHNQAA